MHALRGSAAAGTPVVKEELLASWDVALGINADAVLSIHKHH